METIKAEEIIADIRRILVMGVPFSGKTTLAATAEKPILVFSTDATTDSRLAGQKDIDIIRCYDLVKDLPGSGLRRFEAGWKEILCAKTLKYKTVVIDTFNYFHDDKLEAFKALTPKDTRNAYGQILTYSNRILKQSRGLRCYFIVVTHVRLKEDETQGHETYLPSVQGSVREAMAGRFDAAFYMKVAGVAPKVKYSVRFHPDSQHLCGVKVPIGKEKLLDQALPSNIQEIVKLLRGEKEGDNARTSKK